MNRTQTTTISLPAKTAQRARRLSRKEGRTMSELFREAFRVYEDLVNKQTPRPRINDTTWEELVQSLERVSKAGKKKVNLAEFIARDRQRH